MEGGDRADASGAPGGNPTGQEADGQKQNDDCDGKKSRHGQAPPGKEVAAGTCMMSEPKAVVKQSGPTTRS